MEYIWVNRAEYSVTNAEVSTFLDEELYKLIASHEASRSLTCVSSLATVTADDIILSGAEPNHNASVQTEPYLHRH